MVVEVPAETVEHLPAEEPHALSMRNSVRGGPKVTRVVSADVSVWRRIAEIWRTRELLIYLVRTEISVKYKNSVLGLLWSMLSPGMSILIYFLVFQVVLKNGIPEFVIFLFSGLLAWNFFQTAVQVATGVIVNNAGIVKKVSFPREILALASCGSASVFLFFQASVMAVFMIVLRQSPAWGDFWLLLPALLAVVILAAAMAVFLSAINVYLRDTQHLVEVVLTAWFWACPVVYSFQNTVYKRIIGSGHLTVFHRILEAVYFINPVTPVVMTFQRVLYNKTGHVHLTTGAHPLAQLLPGWGTHVYLEWDGAIIAFGGVLFLFALVIFGRLEGNFAEEL